jgi:hypothetical protein
LLLARIRAGGTNVAASGVLGVGMMFRAVAVMVVVLVIATSNTTLAVSAAIVYALAYTLELALSVVTYFGSDA